MVTARVALVALFAGLSGIACKPDLPGRPSLIEANRVLTIRSTPAEAKPDGQSTVHFDALYVGPDGAPAPSSLQWSICDARKPIDLTSPVALQCLVPASKDLDFVNRGVSVDGMLPTDACSVFGPTQPTTSVAGQPPARPVDPDTTGGYYQPIRVLFPVDGSSDYAVGVTRLVCGLPEATQEQSVDYANRYRPNENPEVDSFVLIHASGKQETFGTDPSSPPIQVTPGEEVTLRVSWAKCPTVSACGDGICGQDEASFCAAINKACVLCPADCPAPCTAPGEPANCGISHGCTGSEPYVDLDPVTHTIVARREGIRVSWFSTAGDFEHDRTGSSEAEADVTTSDNTWTAPGDKGPVPLWVVLRDDRGGSSWVEGQVDVEP